VSYRHPHGSGRGRRRRARDAAGAGVSVHATLADLRAWTECSGQETRERIDQQLAAITAPRPPWAGLSLDRPRLMGVVNVTPDSFSDGGAFFERERAIEHARALLAAGADIIDVGGESTRPGAAPVSPKEEIGRVEPVIRALAQSGALVSIDTRHAAVMQAALAAGARIINDVSAFRGDAESLSVAARSGAAVVLMHMAGDPRTMQHAPRYEDVALDVFDFLEERIADCVAAAIPRANIVVDPGIGFGKTDRHNRALLARLAMFHGTGCGIVLGASRKSFIGRLGGGAAKERLGGSLAAALWAASRGAQIIRVHDVAETRQALAIQEAIATGDVLTES
jgi:dihydropteroate synthase